MDSQGKAKVALTFALYQGDQLVRRDTIAQDIVKVGKDPRSHLRVDDELASRMHAVIDTTIGLVSLLPAYLVYSRAQALGRQRDYMLVFALGFGGLVNLTAAVIQGASSMPLGRGAVWTTTIGRLDVALLFAAAALAPDIRLRRITSVPMFLLGLAIAFISLMIAVGFASTRVAPRTPLPSRPDACPARSSRLSRPLRTMPSWTWPPSSLVAKR